LKGQLEQYSQQLAERTTVCVNSFILTEYYEKIKPKVYLLVDPMYFFNDNPNKSQKEEHQKIFDKLISQTDWDMELIIPSSFRYYDKIREIQETSNIKVLFYNNIDFSEKANLEQTYQLFNENKLGPPAQTVLNTAVYLAIFWRYKNIVLIGADTSWVEQFKVDQNTNIVYMEDRHFYGTVKMMLYINPKLLIPSKLHEEYYAVARALENYWLLRKYAEYNEVAVWNASAKSYIDAFPRKKLEDFFNDHEDIKAIKCFLNSKPDRLSVKSLR
jgi:hypothetical protein